MHAVDVNLSDESATLGLGAALAAVLRAHFGSAAFDANGIVVYLEGDLGAGKTTLVRGCLRALGDTGPVKSPTYTLVELHAVSGLNLYHFDFYRFNQPEEYLDAGLDEYFAEPGACLVEWPDKAAPFLPSPDLRVRLEVLPSGRHARIEAGSERGRSWLTTLAASLAATSSSSPLPA
jgi:tRNA threonylcarbamoyladenosine biosynthesis protein TsaE